ncbi:MAG: phage capsid protein [Bacteroidota bacterium]
MAVQVELWQKSVKEALFASNQFLNNMKNADEYVVGGRIVHIPQSGGPSQVVRNRATLPATITKRSDTDITYVLDEFTTNPKLITNADTVELSYDKRMSVVTEDTEAMMEMIGDWVIYKSMANTPAAQKIATSGDAAAATADGATGDRKILTEADIRKAKVILDNQNVPKGDRYLMMSSDMMNFLYDDDKLKYAFQNVANLPDGVIAKYAGFFLVERSKVAQVSAAQAIKAPDAATATDDAEVAFFWQKNMVERALGEVNMFDDLGRPEYFGDIYSFLIRMGGRACREDNKGYGIIYRDTAA